MLVIRGTTGRDRSDLWLLLLGLAAMALSDSIYGYLTEATRYRTGNLVDIGWVAAYAAIAAGARAARPQLALDHVRRAPTLTRAALVAPFVPILTALTLAAAEIHVTHRLDRVAWTAALVLVGAVLARQVLLAVDLARRAQAEPNVANRLLRSLGETHS